MAQVTKLIDDTDGSEATQTITFGAFGKEYEIDLNDANAAAFLADLTRYATAGREVRRDKIKTHRTTRTPGKQSGSTGGTSELREWARANGYEVSDRGRVAAHIVKAYEERPQGPVTIIGEDDMRDVVASLVSTPESTTQAVFVQPDVNPPTPDMPAKPNPKVPRKSVTKKPNPADTAVLHG